MKAVLQWFLFTKKTIAVGKITHNFAGEMRKWFGEMTQVVGEMKHTDGEMKQIVGEMKQNCWGNEAILLGEMTQIVGEVKQNVLGKCPEYKVTPSLWSGLVWPLL